MKARGKDVLAAIDRADLRERSTLARWMREHHDAFASRLKERTANWTALAGIFADAGLTDRRGNPPKAETARKIWQRVRKEVAAAGAINPAEQKQAESISSASSTSGPAAASPLSETQGQKSYVPKTTTPLPPAPSADYDDSDFGSFVRKR